MMISGGFDPIHKGHIRYIQGAQRHGDVFVALNSDDWLRRKKGYVFMCWEERAEILQALGLQVLSVDDQDGTVCQAIKKYRPDAFAKGGDRGLTNTPEVTLCHKLGIELLWDVGGGKVSSSSELVSRQWGFYEVLHESDFKVKILTLNPGGKTSLQRHAKRNEHWVFPQTNEYQFIPVGETHQLVNQTDRPIRVVEIQTGSYFGEDDIERL